MTKRSSRLGLAVCLTLGCAGSGGDKAALPRIDDAHLVRLGAGHYATTLVAGEKRPSNFKGDAITPKVTKAFTGVPISNDWWSSLIWQFDREGKTNPHSEPLYAHPLSLQTRTTGIGVGSAGTPEIGPRSFFYPHVDDLVVGVEGLESPGTRVDRYDDWSVTASWDAASDRPGIGLTATFGHGMPFVYLETRGGAATVTLPEGEGKDAKIFAESAGAVGVSVGDRAYGVFSPRGSTFVRKGRLLRAELGAKGVFSVAVLPDARPETLARFRRHAFAFVIGTGVSWRYDAATASLATKFTFATELRDPGPGAVNTALVALYPHQWKHLAKPLEGATYRSARGPMKLLATNTFEIRLPFTGVMPVLPAPRGTDADGGGTGFDADELAGLVKAAARADELFPPGLDGTKGSYWTGKSLLRVSLLAWLAEQAGQSEARATFVDAMKRVLEDWFDGQPPNLFGYDKTWATLIGQPSEYRSGWELNDHHFHYGQFIFAAATIARFDPAWAGDSRYGKMVELLIKDCANWERGDKRFPFLRHFDAYAGHSWANGPSLFPEGNNEESSSEEMNFANGVMLWGAITGKTQLRDLGIFLHANLAAAVEQYWFDVDGENFPEGFDRPALGMVWGSGGKYDTWWDRNPIYVHGINYLPFTGGSLYLGRKVDYARRNHEALVKANRGEPRLWREIVWMYLALSDPKAALAQMEASPHYQPEFGVSRAFVYQWMHALGSYGQVDATVTANAPTYAVFRKGQVRHHVAFNPTGQKQSIKFSDGVVVEVGPHGHEVVSTEVRAATASR